MRAQDVGSQLTRVEQADGAWSLPAASLAAGVHEWRLRYEREVARAAAAEARADEWRQAEIVARSQVCSLKALFEANRNKLIEARKETEAIRRTAKDALSLQAEVQRLTKLLYGRRSEQQAKPHSTRRRGQQPGVRGHGRKQRPALAERLEVHSPPAEACVCTSSGWRTTRPVWNNRTRRLKPHSGTSKAGSSACSPPPNGNWRGCTKRRAKPSRCAHCSTIEKD